MSLRMSHCSRIKLGPVEPQLLQSASAGGVAWGRTPPPARRHKGPSSACTVSEWQESEAYTCRRAAGGNGNLDTNGSAVEGGLSLSFRCRGAEGWWVFFLMGVKIQRWEGCKNTVNHKPARDYWNISGHCDTHDGCFFVFWKKTKKPKLSTWIL